MEGEGSVPSSSMMTMTSSSSSGINPPAAPTPVGGCSETAETGEGKKLKTDMTDDGGVGAATKAGGKSKSEKGTAAEDNDDKGEACGGGSGMPLVREQLHPLQNPVILAHLFERCPPQLLSSCRLVSKQWLDLSLTSWRATSPVTIVHTNHGVKYATSQQYLEFMDNPETKCGVKPHRRMILDRWRIGLNMEASWKPFWKRVGDNVTSLEFLRCQFDWTKDLRMIIFGSCSNLKRLALHRCGFQLEESDWDWDQEEDPHELEPTFGEQTNLRLLSVTMPGFASNECRLPFSWLELLSHFPSLTSLKVSLKPSTFGFFTNPETVTSEILGAIQTIRKGDERKLPLRSLELDPPMQYEFDDGPHSNISHLEDLQLPLQSLEIRVDSDVDQLRDPGLEELLNRHSSTLSRITVSHRWESNIGRSPLSLGFPCEVLLEKLGELRIHMLCTSMEFLKNTPKLRKLEFLETDCYGYNGIDETRIVPESELSILLGVKLIHLTEFRMDYRVTPGDITVFAGLMPNVSKLTMLLNDALFSRLCSTWRNVKEMEVLGGELTDQGVTGLDREGNKIATANIANLQGLERFEFWSQNLTERSVFHGFLELPSLKRLEACGGISLGAAAKKSLQDRNIDVRGDE